MECTLFTLHLVCSGKFRKCAISFSIACRHGSWMFKINLKNCFDNSIMCLSCYRSGRMPDSQSSEPGFESPLLRFEDWACPSWLSCIHEYLALDSGGNMSDLVFARNCCMARMLHRDAELVSEWTGLPGRAKSVKRFERSNGPDIALYKNYLYLFLHKLPIKVTSFNE